MRIKDGTEPKSAKNQCGEEQARTTANHKHSVLEWTITQQSSNDDSSQASDLMNADQAT